MSSRYQLRKTAVQAAMEAIDFQGGELFKELTEAITVIKADCEARKPLDKVVVGLIESMPLEAIVKKHTNILMEFVAEANKMINAAVMPPVYIDRNHPFFYEYAEQIKNEDGVKAIRKAGEPLKAGIDLKNGKISGYYTTIKSTFYLYTGIFCNKTFTPAEIAAIILHEIGHVFTYFEFIGFTYRTNNILMATTKAFFETENLKEREMLLVEYKKQTNAKIDDTEAAAKTKDPVKLQTLLLSMVILDMRSDTGNWVYNQRSCEQLADDYASRQGASRDLAMGLDKLYKVYGAVEFRSKPVHWMIQVLWMCFSAALLIWSFANIPNLFGHLIGIYLLTILSSDPNSKIYDDVKDRISNIRRQAVEGLKQSGITKEQKKVYLDDIDAIDALIVQYKDNEPWMAFIWRIVGSRREAINSIKFQKELEDLATNKLYVVANKLETQGA